MKRGKINHAIVDISNAIPSRRKSACGSHRANVITVGDDFCGFLFSDAIPLASNMWFQLCASYRGRGQSIQIQILEQHCMLKNVF